MIVKYSSEVFSPKKSVISLLRYIKIGKNKKTLLEILFQDKDLYDVAEEVVAEMLYNELRS